MVWDLEPGVFVETWGGGGGGGGGVSTLTGQVCTALMRCIMTIIQPSPSCPCGHKGVSRGACVHTLFKYCLEEQSRV